MALTAVMRGAAAAAANTAVVAAAPRVIFSGIQPTGVPHLGNYLGAIRNWVDLAAAAPATDSLIFSVVDLHAMTVPARGRDLRAACRTTAACLLAAGLNPARVLLYRQSDVREHTELGWLLSCLTPLGWLYRMTQFKDKTATSTPTPPPTAPAAPAPAAATATAEAGLGLLAYPVLQAADILLFRATHVPVGEDQVQHIELTRDIARAFNTAYGRSGLTSTRAKSRVLLVEPRAELAPSAAARVMSLRDGRRKMSKSDADPASRIDLTDDADTIAGKVRRAKTDSAVGWKYDVDAAPEKSNLLAILAALRRCEVAQVEAEFATASPAVFKAALTEALVAELAPIGARARELMQPDNREVDEVLAAGADRAHAIAAATMADVRKWAGIA